MVEKVWSQCRTICPDRQHDSLANLDYEFLVSEDVTFPDVAKHGIRSLAFIDIDWHS